jgi:hypothetical protein
MYVVKKGAVTHNGKNYVAGEVLPDMSKVDAARLVKLDVAVEVAGEASNAESAADNTDSQTPAGTETGTPGAAENGVDLSFSPDEAIKAKK